MLVRWLLAVLVVVALATAGCGGSDENSTSTAATKGGSTRRIVGQWAGTLTQAGLPPFHVAALIFSGAGRVAYTGIDCAGDWKLDSGGDSSGSYVFTETINQGAGGVCKGTGKVHLENFAPKRLRYSFEGGGVTSQGILRPARTQVWTAIFREAGVQVGTDRSEPCPKDALTCGATATGSPSGGMSK
jgi:hypothetical protein